MLALPFGVTTSRQFARTGSKAGQTAGAQRRLRGGSCQTAAVVVSRGARPRDPARLGTPVARSAADDPVARSAADVSRLAASAKDLAELDARSSCCRACPRLVAWREKVAAQRRRAFATETYWGRPVPGFGDPAARIVVVGLAPAAHGGNRTGRIFTGDRSGDWLFAALYRAGFARQPTSERVDDGQRLDGARLVAVVRCAPPANKPTPVERDTCRPWLVRELELLPARVLVVLGGFAWQSLPPTLARLGFLIPRPFPSFGHGRSVTIAHPDGRRLHLLASYHPSQQNTFTGKLTEPMLDAIFHRARQLADAE